MSDEWDSHDDETVPCPYCREPVYEGAERCPHCEQYISEEDSPSSPKPRWIILGCVICLIIVGWWIFGR